MESVLLNEGHLVDFAQRRNARADLCHAGIAQERHPIFASHTLDLRGWAAIDDHLADAVGKIKKLSDRGAPAEAAAGTLQAAGALVDGDAAPSLGIETRFAQGFFVVRRLPLAVLANHADEPLRQDAIQSGDEVVRF